MISKHLHFLTYISRKQKYFTAGLELPTTKGAVANTALNKSSSKETIEDFNLKITGIISLILSLIYLLISDWPRSF